MAFWRKADYPPDHEAAMKVPKGGSSCSSCKFHIPEGNKCKSFYFIKYNGSNKIPYPPDEFCSDWYRRKR